MVFRSFIPIVMSAILALFLFVGLPGQALAKPGFTTQELEILTADGRRLTFTVELAISPEQREHGLMERESLDDDRGMLFDFGMTRRAQMWMKNTYVPLDILFIEQNGVIRTIKENALPLSEDLIDSQSDIRFVLELKAGTVRQGRISVGDRALSEQIMSARP